MASTETADNVQSFFSYFEAQHRFLSQLPGLLPMPELAEHYGPQAPDLVRNMRLLQACTHIEALGRLAQPTQRSSRLRFTGLLECDRWSGMAEWGLVSLSELWRAHQDPSGIDDDRLRQKLERIRQQRPDPLPAELASRILPPAVLERRMVVHAHDLDQDLAETKESLRTLCLPAVCHWCQVLRYFTHAAILYRDYRCALAHEARRRAVGWVRAEGDVPYYHARSEAPSDGHESRLVPSEACLVIPEEFVLRALGNCIARLREHCEAETIDPYAHGRFA